MAPRRVEHGAAGGRVAKEASSGKPVDESKYVWLEDFLALLNLKNSVKTSKDAKEQLHRIETEGDSTEKKKKTKNLTEVLLGLVKKEDSAAVTDKQKQELRSFGEDDDLDVEKLGKWMEGWGHEQKHDDIETMGKDLQAKKDKKFFETKQHEPALRKARAEQSREKMELNAEIERVAKEFDKDKAPEIRELTEQLRDASKEIHRVTAPETVAELKHTQKSIIEWTRKLKNEDWEELLDKEPHKDLVPDWVKNMLGDERVEALQRKAVTSELLDGVKSIDKLGNLISKGMSLEDALLKLSVLDRESLHKIYKGDIYRDLRNTNEGLRGLLERVEVIRNPWIGAEEHVEPIVGGREEMYRREIRASENFEQIIQRLEAGNLIPVENLLDADLVDVLRDQNNFENAFRKQNQIEFQIFNQVNYKLLDDKILAHLNIKEWENSRGGAPAYVNKETLEKPELMDDFLELWRDRTRLALRKIAYQQSERQDPVMTELTTLLSIVGIPASEKGMIKVESQIYGMVDALMRGEGNADTIAKLFSLFTNNGVGFRLIDNLKKNREKVYLVKGGIYAGESLEKYPKVEGASPEQEQLRQWANKMEAENPRGVTEVFDDKGNELRMGVFDFMRNMGKRLSHEELQELARVNYFTAEDIADAGGNVENIKMMWGTAIYRKSVDADIDNVKKVFLQKVLKERGKTYGKAVKNEKGEFVYSDEFNDLYGFYGDYIDEAVYFKAVHAETDGIVGNASLKKGSYEFTQGLKEYFVGKLSIQGARYFEAKYLTGNVDEMVGLLDGGIRSIAVMARSEVVNHFVGEKTTTEGNLGASEVFFNKVPDALKGKLVKNWNKLWEKALYHHGNSDKVHHDPTNMFTSFGDEGSVDSGILRPVWNTIEVLKKERNSDAVKELIPHLDYSEFAKIVHDKELSDFLNSNASADAKFDKFIDRFGEDYRTYTGEKSKRWSDWPIKYWVKKMDEAYGLIQELSSDPYSVTVQKKLLDLYTSTNAAGTPAYQRMMQEAIEWYAKDVGAWGTFTRYKKKIDGDRITMVFDAKKGTYGDDQEFPGIAQEEAGGFSQQFTDHSEIDAIDRAWQVEHRAHPKSPTEVLQHKKDIFEMRNGKRKKTIWKYIKGTVLGDPALKTNSLAASYGHGAVGEWTMRQMLLERRAAGFYKNQEQFSKEWGKWAKGVLWNKNKTVLENGWNWFTLNAPFEYVGMVYFGIQGHKLREIFAENTEKNMEKMLHYLNS